MSSGGDQPSGRTLHDTSGGLAAVGPGTLVCIGSPEDGFTMAGRAWSLDDSTQVRFGRASGSELEATRADGILDLRLPLGWVSVRHALLAVDDNRRLRLADLGSRNGTLVEGAPLRGEGDLSPGAIFEIGRSFWMVGSASIDLELAADLELPTLSAPLQGVLGALRRVARSNVPVLLVGETGVGKDRLAEVLHAGDPRGGPLVRMSAMGGPLERMLFQEGRIAAARGGTLVIDDVGELSSDGQAKLLSILAPFLPTKVASPNDDEVRIVTTSTRDVRALVAMEGFRAELYARLAGYEARVPALRDRREDLGLLVRAFATDPAGEPVRVRIEAFRRMLAHDWPFNVRELRHSVTSAAAIAEPEQGITATVWSQVAWRADDAPSPGRIDAVRRELVQRLAAHGGDMVAVAADLRCEPSDVERWMERLALDRRVYAS